MDAYDVYEEFIEKIKDDNPIIEKFGMGDLICNSHIRSKAHNQVFTNKDYGDANNEPLSYISLGMNFLVCDNFIEVFGSAFPDASREVMDRVQSAVDYAKLTAFYDTCRKKANELFRNEGSTKDYNTYKELEARSREFFRDPKAIAFVNRNGELTENLKRVAAEKAKDNYFRLTVSNIRNPKRRLETGNDSALSLNLSIRTDRHTVHDIGINSIGCILADFDHPDLLVAELAGFPREQRHELQMRP